MGSREDRRRQARERREAQERAHRATQARRRRVGLAGAVAGLLVLGALPLALRLGGDDRRPGAPTVTAAALPPQRTTDLGEAVRLAGARRIAHPYAFGINDHTTDPVAYPTNPPTNGPHAPDWAADGSFAGLPAPATPRVVHAQEHGRIVLQYRRGLPAAQLAQLHGLYEESPEHVLLVENATSMPCDVAATAWSQGVLCPRLNARSIDALRAFRDTYRDRGPETVA